MPTKEPVRKSEILVIPGLGRSPRARNPGTQTCATLRMAGVHRFRAWSYGPSRNDGEVGARQGHFLTASESGHPGATDAAPETLGPRFRGGDGEETIGVSCLVRTTRDRRRNSELCALGYRVIR